LPIRPVSSGISHGGCTFRHILTSTYYLTRSDWFANSIFKKAVDTLARPCNIGYCFGTLSWRYIG
ncbi:MAG: hypothetical protein JW963_00155, partial [Anaerolineales bacterium]|nr:hypothetical protein [Anaerolineales bacterium]